MPDLSASESFPFGVKMGSAMVRLWFFYGPLVSLSFPVLSFFKGLRPIRPEIFSRGRVGRKASRRFTEHNARAIIQAR
jgi:hypothetical protein